MSIYIIIIILIEELMAISRKKLADSVIEEIKRMIQSRELKKKDFLRIHQKR